MNFKRMAVLVSGAAILALLASPAVAADMKAAAPGADKWHFTIPVGGWGFGIDGTVGVLGASRDLDLSADDIQDVTDRMFGFSIEFGKGKWTGLVALSHLEFLQENLTGPGPLGLQADVGLDWDTVELGAAYRAKAVNPGPKAFVFDVLGGVRYTKMTGNIEATNGSFDAETDVDWTDPFVGVRLVKSLTPHFGLSFRGDVGGFGFSDSQSQLTWNAGANAFWVWRYLSGWSFAIAGGYKASGIDFELEDDSEFMMDVTSKGPTLGVSFSW